MVTDAHTKPLCVELIGPWASGKTTLVREVSSLMKQRGYNVLYYEDFHKYNRIQRYALPLFYGLISHIRSLGCTIRLLLWYFRLRPAGTLERQTYTTLLKSYLVRLFFLKKEVPDVLLWEGEYHLLTIFQYLDKIGDKELLCIQNTLSHVCTPLIVFIDMTEDEALGRVMADQVHGNQRFSPTEMKKIKESYGVIMRNQRRIEQLFQNSTAKIIHIEGELPIQKKATLLEKEIENMISQRKAI